MRSIWPGKSWQIPRERKLRSIGTRWFGRRWAWSTPETIRPMRSWSILGRFSFGASTESILWWTSIFRFRRVGSSMKRRITESKGSLRISRLCPGIRSRILQSIPIVIRSFITLRITWRGLRSTRILSGFPRERPERFITKGRNNNRFNIISDIY